MRNKIIILFFIFISSCQNLPIFEKVQNYEKVGFAEISKGDQIIHHTIVPSSQIRITNLLNNKNIIVNIDKNSNYKKQREMDFIKAVSIIGRDLEEAISAAGQN